MSAVEGNRADGHTGSAAPLPPRSQDPDTTDVPGILVAQIADLYAASERERRDIGVERAIARARATA